MAYDFSNSKPVSVFSNPSKVFENIVYNTLQNFFKTFYFLAQNQVGFREEKNLNTELAALILLDKLLPALEEKIYAIWVFIDCSDCFDIFSPLISFDKLERCGIRGVSLDFI